MSTRFERFGKGEEYPLRPSSTLNTIKETIRPIGTTIAVEERE